MKLKPKYVEIIFLEDKTPVLPGVFTNPFDVFSRIKIKFHGKNVEFDGIITNLPYMHATQIISVSLRVRICRFFTSVLRDCQVFKQIEITENVLKVST